MSDKVELPNNHSSPEEPAQVHPNPSARVWQQRRVRKHARDSAAGFVRLKPGVGKSKAPEAAIRRLTVDIDICHQTDRVAVA